ncbi:MAG: GNAT family N-acetyltransferase [Youngiibacter sp.]|nr:GNAT family N-acetyltransferase [Youngiibacter sp.]
MGGILIINKISEHSIKLKSSLNHEDYVLIHALEQECIRQEQIALKLELDYKLEDAAQRSYESSTSDINEFMYFNGKQLVGYIGIMSFGGRSLEMTGMVHPDYRQLGVFSKLHELVLAECKRRNTDSLLLLCDNKSTPGRKFLAKIGAAYRYSEYEMYLTEPSEISRELFQGVSLRKTANADAREVARQNAIYFEVRRDRESEEADYEHTILPEEEEKRGMTIYIAEKDGQIIGKVHLQLIHCIGGIYGLGILPEYRGRGLGRALLLEAIEKLKDANADKIMLQVEAKNAKALGLYKSCGFRETSVMDYYELPS